MSSASVHAADVHELGCAPDGERRAVVDGKFVGNSGPSGQRIDVCRGKSAENFARNTPPRQCGKRQTLVGKEVTHVEIS
jgi:hypothetical protein